MLIVIIQALFFFLPAYVANMCPVIFWNVPFLAFLKKPVDEGRKIGNMEIFGQNKTYLGFVAGVTGALVIAALQYLLFVSSLSSRWLFLFDYSQLFSVLLFGFLLGFGGLLGDLFKSFFKRRLNIQNGSPFVLFDQLDFVIGGLLLGALVYVPPLPQILALVILTPLLHFLTNVLAYRIGLKKVWW